MPPTAKLPSSTSCWILPKGVSTRRTTADISLEAEALPTSKYDHEPTWSIIAKRGD